MRPSRFQCPQCGHDFLADAASCSDLACCPDCGQPQLMIGASDGLHPAQTLEDILDETIVPTQGTVVLPPKPPSLPVSLRLADFQLIRKLGSGGMGSVYLAWQRSQQRKVALKVPTVSRAQGPNSLPRFYREAQVLESLRHPGIVEFLGVGEEKGMPFYAMEYIDGFSAAALQKCLEHPLAIGDALHIILKCLHALNYAHSRQVVHRDIKPQNIMITTLGRVKVTDLGLAKPLQPDLDLTESGMTVGTPRFMAPEQARDARQVDGRSDLYALGGVLYLFLIGRAPFEEDSALKLQMAKERGLFPSPRRFNPDLPPHLCLILDRMLARDPAHRFRDCSEAIAAIDSLGLANEYLSFNPLHVIGLLEEEGSDPGALEILMIHDNPADIERVRHTLDEKHIRSHLTVLPNGLEAQAFLFKRGRFHHAPTPDLILLGHDSRNNGTLEAIEEARADPYIARIPVVALAASPVAQDAGDVPVNLTVQQSEAAARIGSLVASLQGICQTIVDMPR